MPMVVLKYPFMRHYAGSVFFLDEYFQDSSGSLYEERISPKKYYALPDAGHGYATSLPQSDIELCSELMFQHLDKKSGPCRITSASSLAHSELIKCLDIDRVTLRDREGLQKQVMIVKVPKTSALPESVSIFDRRTCQRLKKIRVAEHELVLDCSDLVAGFYEARICCQEQVEHRITFIKCFPLVLNRDQSSQEYSFSKAVW